MKKSAWLLCGIVALAMIAGASRAADKPAKEPKSQPSTQAAVRGYYAILAAEVKMTDDQKAKMEDLLKAYNAAMEENKGKTDKELAPIKAKLRADVLALLTPEQKAVQHLYQKFARLSLTTEQKEKLHSMAADAVKQADGKELSEDQVKALDAAFTALLTPEQKAKLDKAAKKPAQTKPAETK